MDVKGSRRFACFDYSESPPLKDVLAVTARRHSATGAHLSLNPDVQLDRGVAGLLERVGA